MISALESIEALAALDNRQYSVFTNEARIWLADCVWGDMSEADFKSLSAARIWSGIRRHYDGGIPAFLSSGI